MPLLLASGSGDRSHVSGRSSAMSTYSRERILLRSGSGSGQMPSPVYRVAVGNGAVPIEAVSVVAEAVAGDAVSIGIATSSGGLAIIGTCARAALAGTVPRAGEPAGVGGCMGSSACRVQCFIVSIMIKMTYCYPLCHQPPP